MVILLDFFFCENLGFICLLVIQVFQIVDTIMYRLNMFFEDYPLL